MLSEAGILVGSVDAEKRFGVTGRGMTAAVLDSGIYRHHRDFCIKPFLVHDCRCGKHGGSIDDGAHHGTFVAGVLAAVGKARGGVHRGIAPDASLVAVRILRQDATNSPSHVAQGLRWVVRHRDLLNIDLVLLAYSDGGNYLASRAAGQDDDVATCVEALYSDDVPVVVGAGNAYRGEQGMGFPAVLPSTISVGAVYAGNVEGFSACGLHVETARADEVAHFSQRLHRDTGAEASTTIFSPGSPIAATGTGGPTATSGREHGTSAAAAIAAGGVLLLQQQYRRLMGARPPVADIVRWLQESAKLVPDTSRDTAFHPDSGQPVIPTGKQYPRLQIDAALALMTAEVAAASASSRTARIRNPRTA